MDELENVLAKFEKQWQQGLRPSLDSVLERWTNEPLRCRLLEELVHIDLDYRLRRAEAARVEEYLRRFPELPSAPGAVARLALTEYRLRQHLRQNVEVDELLARFPHHQEELAKWLGINEPVPSRGIDRTTLFAAGSDSASVEAGEANKIGPYKLIERIGQGGMGTVFKAEQQSPIRRLVAIKLIKPGNLTRASIQRFEAERQALSMMEHPNIASVFEAGITEAGQPYLVMEYVDGRPITVYCDEQRLSLTQRLELYLQACAAIQHAHQKSIIHRDIKPSNVLVTKKDGVPIVKVIDFGLAKALKPDVRLIDESLHTEGRLILGTYPYMSPEQALGKATDAASGASKKPRSDIDTRADVYSLGVLLYELLTGTTPLEGQRLSDMALIAVLDAICHEEPPRPSLRLSSAGGEALQIAADRGMPQAQLTQVLRGDLDWIAMKALEKDRERRYESASSLAEDVRRFLRHEPVVARPPSLAYRLRKTFRRHRVAVLSAAAFLLLLVSATVVSTGLAIYADGMARRSAMAERTAQLEAQRASALAREKSALAETEAILRAEAEAREALIREQRDELAVALSLGFAVVESPYAGNEQPLLEILRTAKSADSNELASRKVEARAHVFRALGSILELLSTNLNEAPRLDSLRLLGLLVDSDRRLSRAIELDAELGLAYLARAELWSRAWATVNSAKPLVLMAGVKVPDADRITSDFDAAVRLLPKGSLAYSGRGWWRYSFDHAGALADLRRAVELDAGNDLALVKLGNHDYEREQFDEALRYYYAAFQSPARVGNLFFANWHERAVRVGATNAAMAVANRATTRPEKLRALGILRVVSEHVEEITPEIRGRIWSTMLSEIASGERPDSLLADMAVLAAMDAPPAFHLTRLTLQGFALIAAGGQVTDRHLEEIGQLAADNVCEIPFESLESLRLSLSARLDKVHQAALEAYCDTLTAIRDTRS